LAEDPSSCCYVCKHTCCWQSHPSQPTGVFIFIEEMKLTYNLPGG